MEIGGQERFEFFKSDFFKGASIIALIFDLARPDTFDRLEKYYNEIRVKAGNIPIILVGNKKDLEKELGILIGKKKILDVVHRYSLLVYIETSALSGLNIKKLFDKMALLALMDIRSPPKLGQIIDKENFKFKVVLAGPAAVGKTTILRTLVDKEFTEQYKLTIGLDTTTQTFEILDEEISQEVKESIDKAWNSLDKLIKEHLTTQMIETTQTETVMTQYDNTNNPSGSSQNRRFKSKYNFLGLIIILICIIIAIVIILNSLN